MLKWYQVKGFLNDGSVSNPFHARRCPCQIKFDKNVFGVHC